jgi:hypothetical protein
LPWAQGNDCSPLGPKDRIAGEGGGLSKEDKIFFKKYWKA